MVTVKNLFSILNHAFNHLKSLEYSLSTVLTKCINELVQTNNSILNDTESKIDCISTNLLLNKSKSLLPSYIKRIRSFKDLSDIKSFRKLVESVTIDFDYIFLIKLNVINNNKMNQRIFDSSVYLKVGNIMKEMKHSIYI